MEIERRSKDREKDRRQFLVDVSGDSKWSQLQVELIEIYSSDRTIFSIKDKSILLRECLRFHMTETKQRVSNLLRAGVNLIKKQIYMQLVENPSLQSAHPKDGSENNQQDQNQISSFFEAGAYNREHLIVLLSQKWKVYYGLVVPTLEAVFLPVQLEFKEAIASKFSGEIDIGTLSFAEFRNSIVLPLLPAISSYIDSSFTTISESKYNHGYRDLKNHNNSAHIQEHLLTLIQMFAILLELPSSITQKEMVSVALKTRKLTQAQ